MGDPKDKTGDEVTPEDQELDQFIADPKNAKIIGVVERLAERKFQSKMDKLREEKGQSLFDEVVDFFSGGGE